MVSCLLIDQNDTERHRIATLLAELGIVTSELSDVETGIRYCHENKPDLVLMAAGALPRSKEFLRLVRYQGQQSGRPVVILYTDEVSMELMGESILQGASEFMMTPFDLELLSFKLRQSGILNSAIAA
jgi:two-component system, chemotaxis family, chemotaxis protein CheY